MDIFGGEGGILLLQEYREVNRQQRTLINVNTLQVNTCNEIKEPRQPDLLRGGW